MLPDTEQELINQYLKKISKIPLLKPEEEKKHARISKKGDKETLKKLVSKYKKDIACIVMEPIRNIQPTKEFIDTIHEIKESLKIPLIVDEISAGFRIAVGGAHKVLGINPDIAVFGKAMSNGYPMSAVIGKAWVMDYAQETFISSTYWTERSGLVASLETIRLFEVWKVHEHLSKVGKEIKEIWKKASERHKVDITITGIDPIPNFTFNAKDPLLWKTVFTQLMFEKGFLASTFCFSSYAHKKTHLRLYKRAVEETFYEMSKKDPKDILKTDICHKTFQRLT